MIIRIISLIALGCLIAFGGWLAMKFQQPTAVVQDAGSQVINETIGGPFELTDQHGRVRRDEEFRGKFMLVYFGYCFCPDICPMGLSNMTKAINLLGKDRSEIVPIFITVDPKRDTVDELAQYAGHFHRQFVMLTGSVQQIEKAKKAYRVYAQESRPEGTAAEYLVDHSAFVYLMDRQGKLIAIMNHNTDGTEMAATIRKHLLVAIQ